MTLNLTTIRPEVIVQVSDRMFSSPKTGVVKPESNKAIIIRCADGTLAITFAGVGTFVAGGSAVPRRIDQWLAESLLESGMAELTCDRVVGHVTNVATALFRQFSRTPYRKHAFVVAGWRRVDPDVSKPVVWVIDNSEHVVGSQTTSDSFHVHPVSNPMGSVDTTGYLPALKRPIRRRLQHQLESSTSIEQIERVMVDAIRDAATDPAGQGVIGKSCMAVALGLNGACRAIHHPSEESPHSFGPFFLWYAGGRGFLTGDVEVLNGSGFALKFGDLGPPLVLVVGSPERHVPPEPKVMTSFRMRHADAKHRVNDPVVQVKTMTFIDLVKKR